MVTKRQTTPGHQLFFKVNKKKSKLFYLDLLRLQQTMRNNLIVASNKL